MHVRCEASRICPRRVGFREVLTSKNLNALSVLGGPCKKLKWVQAGLTDVLGFLSLIIRILLLWGHERVQGLEFNETAEINPRRDQGRRR